MYTFYAIRNKLDDKNLSYISTRRDGVSLAIWSSDLGTFSWSKITRKKAFEIFQNIRTKKDITIQRERHYD